MGNSDHPGNMGIASRCASLPQWASVPVMKRFIIERNIPGASGLTESDLAEFTRKCNIAIASLGVPYRWVNSYIAGDKVYCVHEAEDEDVIREQSRRCGFPANTVSVVVDEFGPHAAERTAK